MTRALTICVVGLGVAAWSAASIVQLPGAEETGPAEADSACVAEQDLPIARANSELDDRVSRYLAPLIRARLFSGTVLIGDRDSIRLLESLGMADYRARRPITTGTMFPLASVTKGFTAAGIFLLRDRGALRLDDRLARFVPDFPRAEEISLLQLLQHRSGVGNPDYLEAFDHDIDFAGLLARIAARPLLFAPGTGRSYSNGGFALLARVIEVAGSTSYAEFLREEVFDGLGMTATGDLAASSDEACLAVGYIPVPGPEWHRPVPASDPTFLVGSGSAYATAPDLWRWARAAAAGSPIDWAGLGWRYVWDEIPVGSHRGYIETGAVSGAMSVVIVVPDPGVFVVMLLNQEFGGWVTVGKDLAAIAVGEAREPVALPRPFRLSPADLPRFQGAYTSADSNTIRVAAERGHLWIYFNEWPIPKYLAPIGPTAFMIPADNGTMRFEEAGRDGFEVLAWDFGDGKPAVFRRAKS